MSKTVLLVEDDADDCVLTRDLFSDFEGQPYALEWVTTLQAALSRLEQGNVELVLMDLYLPDSVGLSTFDAVHSKLPHLPIIVLSGLANEMVAESAVDKGAAAYLLKQSVDKSSLQQAISLAVKR